MPAPQTFRRRHRLTHALEFQRVYGNRVRKSEGPLLVSMAPNNLPEHRLGLSVGRRIGGAVVRTKLKRLIRESFRLARTNLPARDSSTSYDIVVGVRPHNSLTQQDCQAILIRLVEQCHQVCERRARQAESKGGNGAGFGGNGAGFGGNGAGFGGNGAGFGGNGA